MTNFQTLPTLILLHGWGGSRQSLYPLSLELKKEGFKTVLLEMPGHGQTPEMQKPWSMNDFSNWLKNNLARKDIKDYILVGHSFGGKIILNSLINNMLTPVKIILIDSNGIKPKNSLKKSLWKNLSKTYKSFEEILPTGLNGSIKAIIYKRLIGEQDYIKTNGNLKESFKIFNEEHFDEKISKITTKTLIIWGKEDSVTPLWMGEFMNKLIKNSQLKVLSGTHSLPLKYPQKVAKLISDFIKTT